MANIGFSISPAPGVTNAFVAVITKSTAPAAEVAARILIPAPHNNPTTHAFTDLLPGTYLIRIHETTDGGTTLGALHHDFWEDADILKLEGYDTITFQVGLGRGTPYFDPADQATTYSNSALDGKKYIVFKPGYGPLDWLSNITTVTGGGFRFTDNQKFYKDEVYTILISNLTRSNNSTLAFRSYPADIVGISGDRSFDSTMYNMLLEYNVGSNRQLSIDNLDLIPDGTVFGINTQILQDTSPGAAFRYVTLKLNAGKYCMIFGQLENSVYIGRGEEVSFIKKGEYLRLLSWDGDYRRVGEIVYGTSKPPVNSLRLIGGWYAKASMPRLFYWHVNRLSPSEIGTATYPATPDAANRTKWIISGDYFWVPDHGGMFYRAIDPDASHDDTRNPNDYQGDAVGPATVNTVAWTGAGRDHNGMTGAAVGMLATLGDGGTVDTTSASSVNNTSARTIPWSLISPAGQTRPKNVAINAYVII